MRGVFLAWLLLIIAPVYAAEDFTDFLKRYMVFKQQRDVDNQKHSAKFSGRLIFREDQCWNDSQCECPPGNNYLQCLVSAKATIQADPADYGGRGYVLALANHAGGVSFQNQRGQWVPTTQLKPGAYTTMLTPVSAVHVIDIPIDPAAVEQACAGRVTDVILSVGYGAAMPMDIEFARRMKARSLEFGGEFDEEAYIWSRARLNGTRPKKAGEIGRVSCPQSSSV